MKISVIIPLAANETKHQALIASLPDGLEIITSQEGSLAASLNAGAAKATGDYLWFLHADSELDPACVPALTQAIKQLPDALFYFDLAFSRDGLRLMWLNALGARFRSRVRALLRHRAAMTLPSQRKLIRWIDEYFEYHQLSPFTITIPPY